MKNNAGKKELLTLAALFSGGKDSTYAIKLARDEGHRIAALVTMFPQAEDSYMFHVPNLSVTPLLSESLGIPIVKGDTSGIKEKELEDLERVLKGAIARYGINGVLSGAIASSYQKSRVDAICKKLGIASVAPLWGKDQETLLRAAIDDGFKIMLVGVYAEGLDRSFLGKIIDEGMFAKLKKIREKHRINISGEGGEYESLVIDCPLYKKQLVVEDYDTVWKGSSGYINIKNAKLVEK